MNSTSYFAGLKTVADIKKLYRMLAMRNYPDRGGDHATMQEINRQYAAALKTCDGQVNLGDDKKEHTYRYDAQKEQAIIDFIDQLIRSGALVAGVDAFLIGTWVWITGETKPVKDTLKELGCKWHSKRVCWFWNADEKRSWYSNKGLSSLAAQYGASKIGNKRQDEDGRQLA